MVSLVLPSILGPSCWFVFFFFLWTFFSEDTCVLCVLSRSFRWWLGWSMGCFLVTSHNPLMVAVSAYRYQLQTSRITSLPSWSSCTASCKPRKAGSLCSLPPACNCPLPCQPSNHEYHLPFFFFYNIVHMNIFYFSDLTSFQAFLLTILVVSDSPSMSSF